MTQEELDALMSGDVDLDSESDDLSEAGLDDVESSASDQMSEDDYDALDNGMNPPPATKENKMVHQLDDVTKESEEKATEIFDIIENISNSIMDNEEKVQECRVLFEDNIAFMKTLCEKFPNVKAFQSQLEKNEVKLADVDDVLQMFQDSNDGLMDVMDKMQYQDIHRQKIERVINVMRTLSNYLNNLFASDVKDESRVSSAVHIPGDQRDDLVSNNDIEALLESFGANQ